MAKKRSCSQKQSVQKRSRKPAVEREYRTIPELAKRLGCHPEKLRTCVANGELVAHNMSLGKQSRLVVSESDFQDFLSKRRVVPTSNGPSSKPRKSDVPDYVG